MKQASQKKTVTWAKPSPKNQRGVALVEFAVVLPMLVIFMYGVITFSVAILNKQIMTNATREGARAATLYGGEISSAKSVAERYMVGKLINFGANAEPVVTVTTTATSTGTDIKVRATYAYGGLLQFVLKPLNAETTMQR